MFFEVDPNNIIKPELYICKPNRYVIGKLKTAYNIVHKVKLGDLSELEFDLPFDIEIEHQLRRNPYIDLIKHRYLIKYVLGNYTEFFVINVPTSTIDEKSDVKSVTCFSLGYELKDKLIKNYQKDSQNATQVLTDILSDTIWNIDYIDACFDVKFRSFENISSTVLDAVYTIAETFGALVIWNTVDRTVNFCNFDNIGTNKGLVFNYKKYLQELEDSIEPENFCTRLKIYGRDGLTINKVVATGTNYIEDFSYFLYGFSRNENKDVLTHSEYMSDSLCNALLDYNELVQSKQGTFETLLDEKTILQTTLTTKTNELQVLNDQLLIILDQIDVAQATGSDTTQLFVDRDNKQIEIDVKQLEIDNVNADIAIKDNNIETLRNQISIENNFTPEEIVELNQYIIEKEISNEHISDEQELLEWGQSELLKINSPQINLDISIIDLFNCLDFQCQKDREKLNLGDIITVRYDNFLLNVEAKILEITYEFEENNISLIISNLQQVNKDKDKFVKRLNDSINTSSYVNMNKYKWGKIENTENEVNNMLNGIWDATKRSIVAGVDNSVEIGRHGVSITDPTDPLNIVRLNHSCVALSTDAGNTFKNAITPYGVVGEKIIGQILLGENLVIDASNTQGQKIMTVNETGVKISGMDLEITNGGLTKNNINPNITNIWDLAGTSVQIDNIPPTLTNLILEPIKISDKTTGDLKISIAKPNAIDLAGFNIWRNTENNSSAAMLIKSLSVTYEQCPEVLEFIDNDLINEQTYYYWISAFDAQGNECIKLPTIPTNLQSLDAVRPSSPSELIINGGWGRIDLSWTAPEDKNIGKYKILINDVGNADINFAGVTPVYSNTTNYTDFDRINTNARYYRISAIDNVGNESTYISGSGNALLPSDNESPNPPTFGYISSDNNGGITITFNGSISTDALNYRIIRHTCTSEVKANDVNVEIAIIKHLGTGEHKYIDRNLDKNKYYYYQVYTIDNSGRTSSALNIDFGGKAILAIDNTPPTIPSNYNLNVQSKIGAICIDWSHWTVINSAVSYKIYRYDSDGTNEVLMGETLQFQFTDNSMSVVEAETYQYRISALDNWGNESLKSNSTGNVISLTPSTVSDTTPPTMGTFNDPIAQSNGSILLSWGNDFIDEGSGIGGYNIWRRIKLSSTPTYSEKELIQSIRNKNILEFYDITTVHNTTYVYTITCYDNAGNETEIENDLVNWKEVIAFDEIAPNAPTNIIVSGGLGSINVSWTPSDDNDIDYYIIQIGNSLHDFNPPQESYIIYGNSFTDYGRDSLNKRYYRIYSVDKAGNISETYLSGDGSVAIPGDGVAPNKPNTPNVESTYDGSIRITWTHDNPSGDIAKYRIYRINVGDPEFKDATGYGDEDAGYGEAGYAESYAVCVGEVDRDTLQYIDTGLKRNQEYKYSISAIDFSGLKSERTEDSMGIFATDLLAPIAPNVNATGDLGAIKLNWIEVDEVGVTYEIWRSKLGNWIDSEKIATVSGSIGELGVIKYGSYIDYDPPTNETVTWYYKLKAIDAWGNISDFGIQGYATSSINFQGLINGKNVSEVVDFIDNIYPEDMSNLQTQIDGKIETWFQDGDPNTWTEADRLKHDGDMWYSDTTKLLKRYNGTTNSWTTVEDQKAIDAYIAASTAQDTADGKRRVFTTTPTPPYDVGDLWRIAGATDLKVCVISRSTGNFISSDWVNATDVQTWVNTQIDEVETSVSTLQTQITDFSSDLKLTKAEAEALSISLAQVKKESLDLISVATTLSITTQRTNYSSALTSLETLLNTFINASSYPVNITVTNRNDIQTAFENVQDSKSKLINQITLVRQTNAQQYASDELDYFVANVYTPNQQDLQTQIDGKIETWFYDYDPTLESLPASDWTTNELKNKHIDDLFYNTSSGYGYKFIYEDDSYQWELITDSGIQQALENASKAQDTADNKRTVFTSKPIANYQKGDLWIIENDTVSPPYTTKELLVANDDNNSDPFEFESSHWELATRYTDDTVANQAISLLNDISADNKLTPSEKQSLKIVWDAIITEKVIYISQGTIYELTTQLNNYIISLNALTNYLNNSNYSIWQNNIPYTWGNNVVYNGELYNVFNPSTNKNPEISTNYWEKFIPIVFQNLISTTNINGTTLRSKFNDYYSKRSILFEAINNHAVHKDQIYNGVKIDTTNGLTVTKSDDKVRSIFNATEGIKIQRKTSGDWHTGTIIDAFYQDTDGNLIIKGKLEAGSIISDTNISGGTINIGDGNFTVNSSGVLSATGASIQGSIDCTTLKINDTNILDTVDGKITSAGLTNSVNNNISKGVTARSYFDVDGNLIMDHLASISWSKIDKTGATASDVGALSSNSSKLTYIDANGVYTGILQGNIIRTASTSNDRLEMSGTGLKSLNSSNELNGVVIDSGNFSKLGFYYRNDYRGGLEQSAGNMWLGASQKLYLSCTNSAGGIYFQGKVDFSEATSVKGLNIVAKFG